LLFADTLDRPSDPEAAQSVSTSGSHGLPPIASASTSAGIRLVPVEDVPSMIVSDFSVLFDSNWKPDLGRLKVDAADRLIFEAQIDHFDMAVPLVSLLRDGLFEIDATGKLRGSLFEGSRAQIEILLITSHFFLTSGSSN